MESNIMRRLDSITRHLQLTSEPSRLLQPVLLSENLKHGGEEPVIIGGMVLDIHATPSVPSNPRSTTPGKVHFMPGGVARNIAECLWKLELQPYMISAVGLDMKGNMLLEDWKSARLSTEGIRKHSDIETPAVCNAFDVHGELAAGVANVEAIEKFLTPEWIQKFRGKICCAPILMIDANLNALALEASCKIAAESNIPVWFEPVSVAKSRRIVSVVKYISFASPNENELIAMANALSHDVVFHPVERANGTKMFSTKSLFQMLKPAIWVLLEKGVKVLVVTLGSDGVFVCFKGGQRLISGLDKSKTGKVSSFVGASFPSKPLPGALQAGGSSHLLAVHLPAVPASVVRVSGAGDCLVGGTIAHLCAGFDVIQSVAAGIAAAKAAVEAEANVPPVFTLAAIKDDARSVYGAATVVFNQAVV